MKEYTKEYTCVVCGHKGIDKSPSQNRIFCSKECQRRYYDSKQGYRKYYNSKRGYRGGTACKYNEGVACTDHQCENCGWNPAVAKMRAEAIL